METSRRKRILEWATLLVAVLTYIAPLGGSILGIRTAQVVASGFFLYLVFPPALRFAATRLLSRERFSQLARQWPAFRARVTTFREFFTPVSPSSLGGTIERTGRKPVEYEHVLKIGSFLTLMDALSANLSHDVQDLRSLREARRVIRDFETLLPLVEDRGTRLLVKLTDAQLDDFYSAYAAFRQSYREFANEANISIGADLFEGR